MRHLERPTVCRTCGWPLWQAWEVLERLSGVLVSELWCMNGHGWIGSRWSAGVEGAADDDD